MTKPAEFFTSAGFVDIKVAEQKGLEPSASGVTGQRYNRLNYCSAIKFCIPGGRYRTRTCDRRLVRPMLYQLS